MRWLLKAFWRDWSRAPISGAMVLLAHGAALWHFTWTGQWERGMLWLILGAVWIVGRGPVPKEDA